MSKLFRRCGCRTDGKTYPPLPADKPTVDQKAKACPRMVADPKHGKWSFRLSAGFDPVTKRRRQISGGTFATKKAASTAKNLLATKLDKGNVPTASRDTLAIYLAVYLDRAGKLGTSRSRKPLAPTTLENYRRYAEQDIIPTPLAAMLLRDIRRGHVQGFIDELATQRSAVTVRKVVSVVQGALRSAVRDELIDVTPARDLDLPRVTTERFEPWTPEQVGHFLDVAAGHRLGALFEVAVWTGLRRSELVDLTWADVDLPSREVSVRKSKTDAGVRRVPLSGAAVGALIAWQIAQSAEREAGDVAYAASGHVFTMEDGRPLLPQYATRLFEQIRVQADLPIITLHGLRHMAASILLASGADVEFVSKLLGHADVRITSSIYSHMLQGAGREHADRAAASIPRANARTVHTQRGQDAEEAAHAHGVDGLRPA